MGQLQALLTGSTGATHGVRGLLTERTGQRIASRMHDKSVMASPVDRLFVHYSDVMMGAGAMASQITSPDQRKHQSSASLTFVRGIHRWPVNSPHKWPVTRKMFPFDDVTMKEFVWLSSKKISVPITGPLWRNAPVIGGFSSQRASKTESVSLSWHRAITFQHRRRG